MTNSTNNVSLDGNGNLRITPLRDAAGNWTSGRIETNRTDFQPPAGGKLRVEARIQMPNVTGAAAQGYWPAFWMLGRALPGQLPELAERRRAGHHGERPGPQHRLGHDALRHQPGRPVQRDDRHRHQPRLPRHDLPGRLPHLPLWSGTAR